MWIGDHREVSGVCTHPDAQGRGLARALMGRVVNRMLRAGQTPFLHVESGNDRAIAMYVALGFERRAEFPLLYARRTRLMRARRLCRDRSRDVTSDSR